jgi:hypothetical protein
VRLAGGDSVKAAAKAGRVAERTVWTWLANPLFKAEVNRQRDAMIADALGTLSRGATAAAAVHLELLASEDEGIRLRAAQSLLDRLVALRGSVEMAERLAALEARIEASNPPARRYGA